MQMILRVVAILLATISVALMYYTGLAWYWILLVATFYTTHYIWRDSHPRSE